MVTWHLTMKLFPAKCHERATLRKPWCQTGNSSLLPAKCWPLLHMIAGVSVRFSNFAFILSCYITNHLITGPLGYSEFCFPRISMFPPTSSQETLRLSGNKIHCSPWDQSLSVNCHMRSIMFLIPVVSLQKIVSIAISLPLFTLVRAWLHETGWPG